MTTAAAVEPQKKFFREYQPKDEFGNAVGRVQRFEADTEAELADKLAAAHEAASLDVFKTRKALKLGNVLDVDPEEPMPTFDEVPLTADDRVAIAGALNDPNSSPDALKKLLKSFGIPVDAIRRALYDNETQKRITRAQQETQKFLDTHPEYVHSDSNRDAILKYLEKRKLPITKKNLEIAYEDLKTEPFFVVQAPQQKEPPAAPAPTPAPAAQAPVPAAAIPAPATPTESAPTPGASAQIGASPVTPPAATPTTSPSPTPADARGGSGLGRGNASVTSVPTPPKAKGISFQDIKRLSASDYAYALQNGLFEFAVVNGKRVPGQQLMSAADFRTAVEELYKQ